MNTEDQIANEAIINFQQQTGFTATWNQMDEVYDGELELTLKNKMITFRAEVRGDVRLYHLGKILDMSKRYKPFILIAESILPNVRQILKDSKIAYLETNGNAFIEQGDIIIFIDGRKQLTPKYSKPVTNRAFTKTGLKAIFYLLRDPVAINKPYRKLAEETQIALGNIKYIMDGLKEAGYLLPVTSKNVKLQNKTALLERWIAGYRETLKPALFKGGYNFFDKDQRENWNTLDTHKLNIVWSGEPAAEWLTNYLKAQVLTIYTKEPERNLMRALKLIPEEKGPLQLYEQFWQQDTNDCFAPPLLIYADLLITDDPRCIETAKVIYNKYLKNELEVD